MEKFFIFIKHHFAFLWRIIEWGNGLAFSILFKSKMEKVLPAVFREFGGSPFSYKRLELIDAEKLHCLIESQNQDDLKYFQPHSFNLKSIKKQLKKRSFLMMGVFEGNKLTGYFFLRFFSSKKCFVGRLIDINYRGSGIGRIMNNIMYETAWRIGFRCLSTISKNNTAVMKAHAKNQRMIILKELQNDFLLVEFVREK